MKYRDEIIANPDFLHMRCLGPWDAASSRDSWRRLASGLQDREHGRVLLDDRGIELETTTSIDFEHARFAVDLLHGICRKIAIVDIAENDAENRFFETVCVNRGLNLRFFEHEKDAVDWLLDDGVADT